MSASTRNWLVVAIVFVAALGSVLRLESVDELTAPAAQKWEYQQLRIDPDRNANRDLNKVGDGWELFDVEVTSTSSGVGIAFAYCRRPMQ